VLVVGVGLAVGVMTAVLQQVLEPPWFSLVNAASPWLTPMFAVGALWRRSVSAAMAGLATGLLELIGYYATAISNGYPFLGGRLVLFWFVCALVGGPIFGAAGRSWWRGSVLDGFGSAVLPAAWFAEAAVVYGLRLRYADSVWLFSAIGAALVIAIGFRRRQHVQLIGWLIVALPLGLIAELVLGVAYREAA
jgi:hypothetical protein